MGLQIPQINFNTWKRYFINFEIPITITCKDNHKLSQTLIKKNLPRRAIYNNNINVICIYFAIFNPFEAVVFFKKTLKVWKVKVNLLILRQY
jgi:hypothetical protein